MKNSALKKAEKELGKEQIKQIDIIYPACAIVWYRDYGWRKTRIGRRFVTTQEVWDECAKYGIEKSILEMLEEETGVDMQLTGCKDWHEFAYFCKNKWDGKPLTMPQTIYMHQQQKKWIAPMLLACICISLYRDERWGADRLIRFVGKIDELRQELGEEPERYAQMMKEVTGIEPEEVLRSK